jgi:hypothetical protein
MAMMTSHQRSIFPIQNSQRSFISLREVETNAKISCQKLTINYQLLELVEEGGKGYYGVNATKYV